MSAQVERDKTKRDGAPGCSSSSADPSPSTAPDKQPSLSKLASAARPRQSLASLAARSDNMTLRSTSKGTGLLGSGVLEDRTGISVLQARKTVLGGLTQMATASSESNTSNNSSKNRESAITSVAMTTPGSALSQQFSTASSSSPSLSQLAAASKIDASPRRSFIHLASAKPSQPQSSPMSPALGSGNVSGMAARASIKKPSQAMERKEYTQSIHSSKDRTPSISDIQSLQQQKPLNTHESKASTDYTHPSADTDEQSRSMTDYIVNGVVSTDSSGGITEEAFSTETTLQFPSLIASPSHFAVSIFERLNPKPSPLALSMASLLQCADTEALLRRTKVPSIADVPSGTGAATPSRVFQFDTLSPDDIVYKAQSRSASAACSK